MYLSSRVPLTDHIAVEPGQRTGTSRHLALHFTLTTTHIDPTGFRDWNLMEAGRVEAEGLLTF